MKVRRWLSVLVVLAAIVGAIWLVAKVSGEEAAPAGSGGTGTAAGSAPAIAMPSGARPEAVGYVHDGDTVFLDDGTKVRLLGVDTPEVGEHLECYGEEARELLRRWLPQGTRVYVVADVRPLDQYGRSLLFLFLDDGTLVNLELIEQGAAEAVVLEPNVLWADELEAAEDRAQAAGAGMWGAC